MRSIALALACGDPPPCIGQRVPPLIARRWQGVPARVRAPQNGWVIEASGEL
jgi:hypothetical protein